MSICVKQIVAEQKIKRNLGNDGKNQQTKGILLFVFCVRITLSNQETENRKGQTTDFAHDPVQTDHFPTEAKGYSHGIDYGIKHRCRVIDRHGDDRQHL